MTNSHGIARDQLRAFVERIERLEEEKKTIADDIKDVYGEAKGMGFCTKTIKKIVALRKQDDNQRAEEEAILDTYKAALGMIPQLDMFDSETGEVFDGQEKEFQAATKEDNHGNGKQHFRRTDNEQCDAPRVSRSDGRGEGANEGDQGQGAGASESDRGIRTVEGTIDCEDEDGRSRHVGGEARHEVADLSSSAPNSNTNNAGGDDKAAKHEAIHATAGTLVSNSVPATHAEEMA